MREAVVKAAVESLKEARTQNMAAVAVSPGGPSLRAPKNVVDDTPAAVVVDGASLVDRGAVPPEARDEDEDRSPAQKRRCFNHDAQYDKGNNLGATLAVSYGNVLDETERTFRLLKAEENAVRAKRELQDIRSRLNRTSEETSVAATTVEQSTEVLKKMKRKHAQLSAQLEGVRLAICNQEKVVKQDESAYRDSYHKSGEISDKLLEKREQCVKLDAEITELKAPYAGDQSTSSVRAGINLQSLSQVSFDGKTHTIGKYDTLKEGGYHKNDNAIEKARLVRDFIEEKQKNPNYSAPPELSEWLPFAGYQGANDMGDLTHWRHPLGRTYTNLRYYKYRLAFFLDLEIDCTLNKEGKFDDYLPGFGPNA